MTFTRITVNLRQMEGLPCIRGLPIPVPTVVGLVADGTSEEEIFAAFTDLEREYIREDLRYAAEVVGECELPLVNRG
jgi:uncharacterized protein (DUF433 family)